jgi:hypothetical protein
MRRGDSGTCLTIFDDCDRYDICMTPWDKFARQKVVKDMQSLLAIQQKATPELDPRTTRRPRRRRASARPTNAAEPGGRSQKTRSSRRSVVANAGDARCRGDGSRLLLGGFGFESSVRQSERRRVKGPQLNKQRGKRLGGTICSLVSLASHLHSARTDNRRRQSEA